MTDFDALEADIANAIQQLERLSEDDLLPIHRKEIARIARERVEAWLAQRQVQSFDHCEDWWTCCIHEPPKDAK